MTNRSKHTPGPWRIGDAGRTVFGPPNGQPAPEVVATGRNSVNIRLCAAAPELLAALEQGEDIISGLEAEADNAGIDLTEVRAWWRDVAGAAIAKAKGE